MIFLYAFALVAGVANAFQAGTNSTFAKALHQPFLAALIVVGISALALAAAGLVSGRLAWPTAASFAEVPWWGWVGGILSAMLLMSQLFVAEAIGAGPFLGIIVVTGTVASLLIDNYGLVGFKVHELNLWRVAGGVLMSLGVLLVDWSPCSNGHGCLCCRRRSGSVAPAVGARAAAGRMGAP